MHESRLDNDPPAVHTPASPHALDDTQLVSTPQSWVLDHAQIIKERLSAARANSHSPGTQARNGHNNETAVAVAHARVILGSSEEETLDLTHAVKVAASTRLAPVLTRP